MASKRLPTNPAAENGALSCALILPDIVLPIYVRLGLQPEQFSGGNHQELYRRMLELFQAGKIVDQVTVVNLLAAMPDEFTAEIGQSPSSDTAAAARDYAQEIVEYDIARKTILATRQAALEVYPMDMPVVDIVTNLRGNLENVLAIHSRTVNPRMANPADALEEEDGWSVQMGIDWFDQRIRWTSGHIHGLAGDPSTGKSLCAIQSAAYNVSKGVPTALIVAEDKILDIQLTMLAQKEDKIDMWFVNRIRYDRVFKTPGNLAIVREQWDKYYKDTNLIGISTTDGPQDVLNAIEALPGPHYVIVDHAYAVVFQSKAKSGGDYKIDQFNYFYTQLKILAARYNHIVLILNQYKISARGKGNVDRGRDAQFGGPVIANALITQVHMWEPDDTYPQTDSANQQAVRIQCVKTKSRMVIDPETGGPKNPLDGVGTIFIKLKYRLIKGEDERPMYL